MHTILGLGTYPIVQPVHGGQRRVAAFREHYRGEGVEYHYACVFERAHYSGRAVGESDLPMSRPAGRFARMPFMEDVTAGEFAAHDPRAYDHFVDLVARLRPQSVQLEQPFMWPLVKRLREEGRLDGAELIYSSHNVEGPLKAEILRTAGVSLTDAGSAEEAIAALEGEIVDAADLIFAVSRSDAEYYSALAPGKPVSVIPNGVSRYRGPPGDPPPIFGDEKVLIFIGSAYPPNVNGFCELLLERGLYFLRPEKQLAVCGGVSDGIFQSREYQADLAANSERVHFFPRPSDAELDALRRRAHAFLLPITFGGGSNLKTAEALVSGSWVIATQTAMRGFEEFRGAKGVVLADTPREFRRAVAEVLRQPALVLNAAETKAREALYWEGCFEGSGIRGAELKAGSRPVAAS